MADNPHEEFVYIRLGGDDAAPGRVTRAAFDQIWKAKGFSIVDTDEAEQALSVEETEPPATTSRKRG